MFKLSVITPEKIVYDKEAISVNAPGTLGYFEILQNHAPFITSLQPGKLEITDDKNNKLIYAISGGMLEMYKNECTVLGDAIEAPEEIDINRAKEAKNRAEKRIAEHEKGIDLDRAKNALHRANNRIHIYQKYQAHETHHQSVVDLFE